VLRISGHETVPLDTGGSIDLNGCQALWSPTRRGRRRRAIGFGIAAVAFAIGAMADSISGNHNAKIPLVIAGIAAVIALHQAYRALVTYLAPNEPAVSELLLRTPQGRLLVEEVVSAGPQTNEVLALMKVPGPSRIAWREVSPSTAFLWLQDRSRSDAQKLFPDVAATASR
jgi:hypothetical protein